MRQFANGMPKPYLDEKLLWTVFAEIWALSVSTLPTNKN